MVKVFCDMCGCEIDYEVDGVNLDFNHYGVVNFKTPFSAEKQLCLSCAAIVCNFVENSAKMDGGADDADEELCDKCEISLSRLSGYAVPVVRCKDCKHEFGGSCIICGFQKRKPEDFCSYGERKDDADG